MQMTRGLEQRLILYSVGRIELHFWLIFRHHYNK